MRVAAWVLMGVCVVLLCALLLYFLGGIPGTNRYLTRTYCESRGMLTGVGDYCLRGLCATYESGAKSCTYVPVEIPMKEMTYE